MVDLGNWLGEAYMVSRVIDPDHDAEAIEAAVHERLRNEEEM